MQLFSDRKEELRFLEERYGTGKAELVVLYGRRRIGKTELVKHFIQGKPHIYFLCDLRHERALIGEMQGKMADFLQEPLFARAEFEDWVELFREFSARLPPEKRPVLVMDEFSYLISQDRATPSMFQKIWDEYLKGTNVFLILLGSSVSLMETEVLGHKSPLFGRRTGQWRVDPVAVSCLPDFFPDYESKELIQAYAVLDGIPGYLVKFDSERTVEENILDKIFRRGEYLYEEVDFLLRDEFRKPGNYLMVLEAIARGKERFTEIAHATGFEKPKLSRYLKTLENLHITERVWPVTDTRRGRIVHHRLQDNFFRFYFNFVFPVKADIEIGNTGPVMERLRERFPAYLGRVFEQVTARHLPGCLPVSFPRIGPWWHREQEIDLVGLDPQKKRALFVECKWKVLEQKEVEIILSELERKAEGVDWHNKERKEMFAVVAKGFKGDIETRDGVFLVGADELLRGAL